MNIHAIQTGVVHVKTDFLRGSVAAGGTVPFLFKLFTDKQYLDLPIYTWVIEHNEGIFVVDTGDKSDTEKSFITRSTFTIKPEEEIGAQLRQKGIRNGDIRSVIVTHLHSDHIDGVSAFENIPVLIGEKEHNFYRSGFGGTFTRRTARIPSWFDPKPIVFRDGPVGPFEQSARLTKAGDVIAVPTPGHTAGHMSIIAIQDGISYFLAGDVSYDEQALLNGTLQGPTIDAVAHPKTLAKVLDYARSTPTVYLPAHDWKSGERLTKKQTVPVA